MGLLAQHALLACLFLTVWSGAQLACSRMGWAVIRCDGTQRGAIRAIRLRSSWTPSGLARPVARGRYVAEPTPIRLAPFRLDSGVAVRRLEHYGLHATLSIGLPIDCARGKPIPLRIREGPYRRSWPFTCGRTNV